jgi:hypothetical protein
MEDREQNLIEIQELLIKKLLERLSSGKVSDQDLRLAKDLLKDNNITAVPKKGSPLKTLKNDLEIFQTDKVVDIGKYKAQ